MNLIHSCTIATPGAAVTRDKDNQPIPAASATTAGVFCRYGDLSRTEIANLAQSGIEDVRSYLLLPRGTVIAQHSRVSAITHRLSGVLEESGPFEVAQLLTRRGYGGKAFLSALLRRVS